MTAAPPSPLGVLPHPDQVRPHVVLLRRELSYARRLLRLAELRARDDVMARAEQRKAAASLAGEAARG